MKVDQIETISNEMLDADGVPYTLEFGVGRVSRAPRPPAEKPAEPRKFWVVWEIEVSAEDAEAAARKALEIQRNPDSSATVFDVFERETDGGGSARIDLLEIDEREKDVSR